MKKALALGAGYLFLLAAAAGTAHAGIGSESVPEVDAGSLGAAMALVAGSFLVIVSRFHRK